MALSCPNCGHPCETDGAPAGQAVRCPNCNHALSSSESPLAAVAKAAAAAKVTTAKAPPKEKAQPPERPAPAPAPRVPQTPVPPTTAIGCDITERLTFECPRCKQQLKFHRAAAGRLVYCPSCDARVRVPEYQKSERRAWKEADPTNPPFHRGVMLGLGLLVAWYLLLLPFVAPSNKPLSEYNTMQYLASLFYRHFAVALLNTLFFTWAMAIIFLKHRIIRHQKAALLLDVLPSHLGTKIHAGNVAAFLDHVYAIPVRLRDSLMVNRIRKALELYEIRQNVGDVREMMISQSEIDSARISGSYTLLRAFLWAIPLLGFIGTVVGLSHAIGGMSFANVEDVGKIISAINNVTSGLGTAFDATLLGLVLALTLNFPLNTLAKQEDNNLQTIDAFCNEVLLPRLQDSTPSEPAGGSAAANFAASSLAETQKTFLADLGELSKQMNEYARNLDRRMEDFQKTATTEFVSKVQDMRAQYQAVLEQATGQIVSTQEKIAAAAAERSDRLGAETDRAIKESLQQVARYIGGLEAALGGLNGVLKDLGEKLVMVNAPKKE